MAKAKDFRVLLIRSGRNGWDQQGRLTGSSDLPLCEEGRAEVQRMLAFADGAPISVVLSAPDEASTETARAFAGFADVKVKPLPELVDLDMGLWEGLLGQDLEERYPTAYKRWLQDPSSVSAPDGEQFAEAEARILEQMIRALDKVREAHPVVAVVLRPLAYGMVRARLLGQSSTDVWTLAEDETGAEWHIIDRERLEALTRAPAIQPGAA